MSGKITEVTQQGGRRGRLGPVIVDFEHATSHSPAAVAPSLVPSLTHSFHEERDASTANGVRYVPKVNLKLRSRQHDIAYSTEAPAAKSVRRSPYLRTFLALRNKRTGQTRLVEANPTVVAAEVTPPKTNNPLVLDSMRGAEEQSKEEASLTREQDKKRLVKEFGQAKGQRMYSLADRMKVENEQLEGKMENAAMNVSEDALAMPGQVAVLAIAPPKNSAARTPGTVYSLDDILTGAELNSLKEYGIKFCADQKINEKSDLKTAVENKTLYRLTATLMESNFDDPESFALALYVEAVLRLTKNPAKKVGAGPISLTGYVPMDVAKRIYTTFAVKDQYRIDAPGKDRGVCYALVVALLLSNYMIDFKTLTDSVKARPDHLKKLIAMTGAQLVSDVTGISSVVLRMPLVVFSEERTAGRKKGGR